MKTHLFPFVLLLAAVLPLGAEGGLAAAPRVDWPGARVVIDASAPLDPGVADVSKARYLAETELRRALPELLQRFFGEVLLDSRQTVGGYLREAGLPAAGPGGPAGRVTASNLAPDFRRVRMTWEAPLYGAGGLASGFVTHARPFPLARFLGFVPSRPRTGLVIWARGPLPVFPASSGGAGTDRLRPALFFRLFDPELHPVLAKENCDPEALERWGMAAWSYGLPSDGASAGRVGEAPLRVLARGVYGQSSTDLVLSREAARELLGREENRRLLREGRILIVIDPPS